MGSLQALKKGPEGPCSRIASFADGYQPPAMRLLSTITKLRIDASTRQNVASHLSRPNWIVGQAEKPQGSDAGA
jgi:hypothetical protein